MCVPFSFSLSLNRYQSIAGWASASSSSVQLRRGLLSLSFSFVCNRYKTQCRTTNTHTRCVCRSGWPQKERERLALILFGSAVQFPRACYRKSLDYWKRKEGRKGGREADMWMEEEDDSAGRILKLTTKQPRANSLLSLSRDRIGSH